MMIDTSVHEMHLMELLPSAASCDGMEGNIKMEGDDEERK